MESDTYIVRTTLATRLPFLKPIIENLVQTVSQVESIANLVYTRAILSEFEKNIPFHVKWVDQASLYANCS